MVRANKPAAGRLAERELRAIRAGIGRQIEALQTEAGPSTAALARCAGVDRSHLVRIKAGDATPSVEALAGIARCLGADLGIRLFPIGGPRVRDRFQAPMVDALLRAAGLPWRGRPEVPVPAARGVIDLILTRRLDHLTLVCECHSELRQVDLVLRRIAEKTAAMRRDAGATGLTSSLLVIRSTQETRSIAQGYAATLGAAFPARAADAVAALRGTSAWPGAAIVWARVEGGRAEILDTPPRGIRLGR